MYQGIASVLVQDGHFGMSYEIAIIEQHGDVCYAATGIENDGVLKMTHIKEGEKIPTIIRLPRHMFESLKEAVNNAPMTVEGKNATIKAKDAHLADMQIIVDRLFKRFIDKQLPSPPAG
jgi:hypothetical protein